MKDNSVKSRSRRKLHLIRVKHNQRRRYPMSTKKKSAKESCKGEEVLPRKKLWKGRGFERGRETIPNVQQWVNRNN